jgi:PAS domain S-box-containing protein
MTQFEAIILLVEDFTPDRELYRRYLEADEQYSYQILESETGEEGLRLCQQVKPDVILLDYQLPDMDGLEFLQGLKQIFPANSPLVIKLTGQGNETVAKKAFKSGASDYLIKRELTADILNGTIHQILKERRQQKFLNTKQELAKSISLRIRENLQVSDIFKSSVEQVREFLECDRVLVYQLAPDMSGKFVAESVVPGWKAALNNQINDTCFQSGLGTEYQQGRRRAIDNIYQADLTECHINLLEQYQVKSNLVVPILLKQTTSPKRDGEMGRRGDGEMGRRGEDITNYQLPITNYPLPNSQLWGLLIAHQCSHFRHWETSQLELLEELAQQIALTLQPLFLLEKLQQENSERQKLQERLTQINRTLEAQVKERTEALSQSEQKFRNAFESASIGMGMVSLQKEFLAVNSSACQIFGYSESELLTMTCNDIIYPDDLENHVNHFQKLLAGETSYFLQEQRYIHKDGHIIWAFLSVSLVRNHQQQPQYFIAQLQDITQRKLAEEALNSSWKRYRELFEGSVDGIAMTTLDGIFFDCNASYAKMLGYSKAELIGKRYSEITPAKWYEMERKIINEQIMKRGYSELYEKEYIRKDGTIFPIELNCYCVFNEAGEPQSLWAIVRDISERKQAQLALQKAKEAAEAANRAKSTFLGSISHELRTPLNAILGFSQILARSNNLSPDEKENIRIINKSGEHLLNLINQILDVTKSEAGLTTLNETAFDLHSLLDELKEMFQPKAEEKNLPLNFQQADNVPQYVKTDAIKLRQILINLLTNALKFTQEGGVTLRIFSQPISLEEKSSLEQPIKLDFEVEDTGLGISQNELAKLFQAFVQTQTGKALQQGTGLGLVISKQFVQLLGGEITVSSQVGIGSIFKFHILAKIVDASSIQMQPASRRVIALEPNQPKYRILIVDDDANNRRLLLKLLYPLGFDLKEASNGQEAIEVFLSYSPHLIFMDMRMPVMNGYKAANLIKSSTQGQSTIIVAVTASSLDEQQSISLFRGCDDFIRKPFQESEIFDSLNKHLGVRYIYSELKEETQVKESLVLTAEDLAILPPDWLESFQQAAMQLDMDLLLNMINQIQEQHQSLAKALADMVNQYKFEELLALTQA